MTIDTILNIAILAALFWLWPRFMVRLTFALIGAVFSLGRGGRGRNSDGMRGVRGN